MALPEASAGCGTALDPTGASVDSDVGLAVPLVAATTGVGRDDDAVGTGFPIVAARSLSATGGSTFVAGWTSTSPSPLATCIGVRVPPVGATTGVGRIGAAVATGFPD